MLFRNTYRRVVEGQPDIPDDAIISISSKIPKLTKICAELSQPTYTLNIQGKIVIDKTPDGARSPNLGDVIMMRYSRTQRAPMRVSELALQGV